MKNLKTFKQLNEEYDSLKKDEEYDSLKKDEEFYKKLGYEDVTISYSDYERILDGYNELKRMGEKHSQTLDSTVDIIDEMGIVIDNIIDDNSQTVTMSCAGFERVVYMLDTLKTTSKIISEPLKEIIIDLEKIVSKYKRKIMLNYKSFILESKINRKYYIFDWDDNILQMPTRIYLYDKEEQKEISVFTEEFSNIRNNKDKYEYLEHSFIKRSVKHTSL